MSEVSQAPSAFLVVGYFQGHPQVSSPEASLSCMSLYLHQSQPHSKMAGLKVTGVRWLGSCGLPQAIVTVF